MSSFSAKNSWTKFEWCDGAQTWIEMQSFLFMILSLSGRSSFSKCFFYVFEFWILYHLQKSALWRHSMLHNLKPSIFWIVYLFGGKVNYDVHHPFCQLRKHNCGLRRNSRVKSFSFYHLYRSVEDISLLIKYLNPRRATGSDFIPLKVIKFVWNVIDPHLHNIIKDLEKNKYSEGPKAAFSRKMKEIR